MANPGTRLEFSLDDRRGGVALTPETVDLPTLRGFLKEVEDFVKGNEPSPDLAESRVELIEGSIKLVVVLPFLLAQSVAKDLQRLAETKDLDAIQAKRAAVVEKWQARTLRLQHRSYGLGPEGAPEPLIHVAANTTWQRGHAHAWVAAEKYLSGRVVDLGGKKVPNVHLVLADGNSILVSSTEEALGGESENHLYQKRTLRVKGEENIFTGELRNVRLLEFVPRSGSVDEEALERLWRRGSEAWANVDNPSQWVEELRGH